jgi:hypothetical protein
VISKYGHGAGFRKKVILENKPKFDQAGVENSFWESQKRTQVRGGLDWQNGLSEGKSNPS